MEEKEEGEEEEVEDEEEEEVEEEEEEEEEHLRLLDEAGDLACSLLVHHHPVLARLLHPRHHDRPLPPVRPVEEGEEEGEEQEENKEQEQEGEEEHLWQATISLKGNSQMTSLLRTKKGSESWAT